MECKVLDLESREGRLLCGDMGDLLIDDQSDGCCRDRSCGGFIETGRGGQETGICSLEQEPA